MGKSQVCIQCFDALVGQKEGHLACENWVVRYWRGYLFGVRCKWFACHCHPIISCFIKIQNVLPFWCWLTQVVLKKRLLTLPLPDIFLNSRHHRVFLVLCKIWNWKYGRHWQHDWQHHVDFSRQWHWTWRSTIVTDGSEIVKQLWYFIYHKYGTMKLAVLAHFVSMSDRNSVIAEREDMQLWCSIADHNSDVSKYWAIL